MNHIDDTFKQLENDHFIVPDSFLEDLNQRLDEYIPEKKKRRGNFFWVMLSAIVIGTLIAMTQFFNNKTSNNQTAISQQTKNKNLETSSSIYQDGNQNNKKLTAHSIDSNHTKTNNSSPSENIIRTAKNSQSLHPLSTSSRVNESKNKNFSSLDKTLKSSEKKQSTYGDRKEKFTNPATRFVEEKLDDDLSESNHAKNSASNHLNEQSSRQTSGVITKNIETISSYDSENTTIRDDNQFIHLHMNPKSLVFPERNLSLEQRTGPLNTSKDLVSASTKNAWSYDLQIYGGISQALWKMKPMNNTSASEVTRTLIFSPTVGIKGNVFFNNINASLGLEYYQSNQKLKFTTKSLQQTSVDSAFLGYTYDTIFIDSLNWFYDSTAVYQYTPVFDSISEERNQKNSYTWLSIPVSFGYRFNYQSWSFIPRVGIHLNFGIAENRGSYPYPGFNLQEHEAVRFNTDIMIQTEIRKNFNKFHIFLTPYYRGNLSPMLKATTFNISHQSWGVNFGLGIDL